MDKLEQARSLIKHKGICQGLVSCRECALISWEETCNPSKALDRAQEYIEKHSGESKCMPLKFKVGDKVQIVRKDERVCMWNNAGLMDRTLGAIGEITSIADIKISVSFENHPEEFRDGWLQNFWVYNYRCLELVNEGELSMNVEKQDETVDLKTNGFWTVVVDNDIRKTFLNEGKALAYAEDVTIKENKKVTIFYAKAVKESVPPLKVSFTEI